ncbi:MAG: MarR family transcriptional regulator [Candidatus Eisenbacteria bacterium]|uniref:MarR family transcriptional regulator n=1 Tax=Eiseniibacteriota bacterium TaxID=2212470 RepID=A0A956NB28_UNCEI|nr:MarR family transcriptional regulator [Candidatus Eisenbacteria bacterium]
MHQKTLADEIQSKPIAPEVAAFLNIVRTADQVAFEVTQLLRPHGITQQQYNVLRILRGAGEAGLPCLEIGARMVTRVPDVTRLVDRMERSGLVSRQRSDEDRRVVRIHITRTGLDLVDQLLDPIMRLHRTQVGHLDGDELVALNRLLEKVRARDGELSLA